jgi:hypothetical protein
LESFSHKIQITFDKTVKTKFFLFFFLAPQNPIAMHSHNHMRHCVKVYAKKIFPDKLFAGKADGTVHKLSKNSVQRSLSVAFDIRKKFKIIHFRFPKTVYGKNCKMCVCVGVYTLHIVGLARSVSHKKKFLGSFHFHEE